MLIFDELMRLAVIDLGTNSVRFDVHEIREGGEVFQLHREKLMIRLGEGVFLKGRLDVRATHLCLEAFKSFQKTISELRVKRIVAFGTSALREARDGERLIREIERKTRIRIRIISGEEEAGLIAKGILSNESSLRGYYALIDIGGGSTELSVCRDREIVKSASFPLGTARLQQVFLKTIPPGRGKPGRLSSVDQLRRHIRSVLLYKLVSEEWPKAPVILGSSGTIRALSKIIKKITDQDEIERGDLQKLIRSMLPMKRQELLRISGMEPRRVDMILSGAILLEECMNALHAETVEMTEYSLRDGILENEIELLKKLRHPYNKNPLLDLLAVTRRMGFPVDLFKHRVQIAESLFDGLKRIHQLPSEWKYYLITANVLHDFGRSINPISYESHSAYIASFVDVPHWNEDDLEFIAALCLRHTGSKVLKKDLPFKKNKRKQKAFLKLLAILRIAVAMSFQQTHGISLKQISSKGRRLTMRLSARQSLALEILRADQRKALFEDVFKRELSFERI